MKRSPMKRRAMKPRTTPMRRRSARVAKDYAGDDGRVAFVVRMLVQYPMCQVCGVEAAFDVHESILRSRSGAIVPGPLADVQGQRFFAVCRQCHDYIHTHRPWAETLGYLDPRPGSQIPRAT